MQRDFRGWPRDSQGQEHLGDDTSDTVQSSREQPAAEFLQANWELQWNDRDLCLILTEPQVLDRILFSTLHAEESIPGEDVSLAQGAT